MQSPTYTTLPISGADVISRSIQNASSFISTNRPWSELFSSDGFTKPESLSIAGTRLKKNMIYFRINYAIVILACTLLALIGSPISLVVFAVIFALWLVLYFFREDQIVVQGYLVNDQVVFWVLLLVSILSIWFVGFFWNVVLGIGFGLIVLVIHGALRNHDGLFLIEEEAFSRGFIASGSAPVVAQQSRVDFSKPR